MKKKTFLLIFLAAGLIIIGVLFIYFNQGNTLSRSQLNSPATAKEIVPSETSIDYTDPSGFSFSYPDNLSISNSTSEENADPNAYADLQLFSKDKNGSLTLKITDTKFTSLDEWLEENKIPSSTIHSEKKLGELSAWEVKTTDRLLLGAIDKGVLFTIEEPLIEQNFWEPVYNKVLTDFTFASPNSDSQTASAGTSSDEVVFEGEEVVE